MHGKIHKRKQNAWNRQGVTHEEIRTIATGNKKQTI